MKTLTIDEVIEVANSKQESSLLDFKADFTLPKTDEQKGEFLKDLAALANSCSKSYGYIIFGIDKNKPDPLVGISASYDDAKLQQLVEGKINPKPSFLYYEVSTAAKNFGVLQVQPTNKRPHIISIDLGKVRQGQILVREGSSTRGVKLEDLFEFFYGSTSVYFSKILQQQNLAIQQQMADVEYLRELRIGEERAIRDMEMITGVKLR